MMQARTAVRPFGRAFFRSSRCAYTIGDKEISAPSNTPQAMTLPRYAGIPTFLRADIAHHTDKNIDIALFGVPFDGGVTNRPGTRHGPRDVRNASSLMRAIHHHWKIAPFSLCQIADVGDVDIQHIFNCKDAHSDIEAFVSSILANKNPRKLSNTLAVGGDHSVTLPILRAIAPHYAKETQNKGLSLIHIDAHTDTWDSVWGENDHHGAPIRRAVEAGAISPKNTIQIGIRGPQNFPHGWDYSNEKGIRVMFMEEAAQLGPVEIAKIAKQIVGDSNTPTYVTFDIDSLDPAYAPGTGTPEVGGFTTREAIALLRELKGLNIIGADVVEVSPPFDVGASGGGFGVTSLAGATIMWELLCLMAQERHSRLNA